MSEDAKKIELPKMEVEVTSDMVVTVKGEKDFTYRFYMPFGSSLKEGYSAAVNIAHEIAKVHNEAMASQKKEEESAEAKENKVEEGVEKVSDAPKDVKDKLKTVAHKKKKSAHKKKAGVV